MINVRGGKMYRIGQSTDVHQLKKDRKLILGGVEIEHEFGLDGHSDADALLHAIAEAILGAMAMRDLGTYFSDLDETTRGQSSRYILRSVASMMSDNGYEISNIDSLIMIEEPKMAPHIEQMRINIASDLNTQIENVNVKATRGEKIGFVGRKEGVMAQAVVLLKRVDF